MRSHVSSSSSEDRRSASEASTPSASSGMSSFSVPCEPSVSHVSEKVVSKIKRGELVDMAKLLRKDKPHDSEQLLSLSSDGLIQLAEKSVPITSFYKWMDAFLVFMSIRGRYFPHEFQGMLRHVELVKQVFSDNNDGSLYDYKFRAAKADFPQLPWGRFMPELVRGVSKYSASKSSAKTNSANNAHKSQTAKFSNSNYCNYFNYGKCSRTVCSFGHKCLICHKPDHGLSQCPNKKGKAGGSNGKP